MRNFLFILILLFQFACKNEENKFNQENKYEVIIEKSCGFDKDVVNKKVYAFSSDIEADKALERIMKLTGLPPNFEIKAANVDNACAVVKCDEKGGCKRIIYYNQEFIEKMNSVTNTDLTELAILAHEIGHHLSGHTISEPKNRYEEELEADKFAGFILHQLGASIETAKNVFSYLPEEGSNTHPPKSARIAAITNGWYDSKRKGNVNSSSNKINEKINYEELLTYNANDNNIYIEYNTSTSAYYGTEYIDDFSEPDIMYEATYNNHIYYDQKTMKLLNARVVDYYENGKQKFNFYIINGKVNGRATRWYNDGSVSKDMNFSNGIADGLFIENYGDLYYKQLFKKGRLVWSKTYQDLYYNSQKERFQLSAPYINGKREEKTYKILMQEYKCEYDEINAEMCLKKVVSIMYADWLSGTSYVFRNQGPFFKQELVIEDKIGIEKRFQYNENGDLIYPLEVIHTILEKDKFSFHKMRYRRIYRHFKIEKFEMKQYDESGNIVETKNVNPKKNLKPQIITEYLADSVMDSL